MHAGISLLLQSKGINAKLSITHHKSNTYTINTVLINLYFTINTHTVVFVHETIKIMNISAQNNTWKLVGHLFKVGTLL